MTKPDDSTLDLAALLAVEERARAVLSRADAWGRFPTPVDDILQAAKLRTAPTSMFDPVRLMGYLRGKANQTAQALKSAISKVLGIYDAGEQLIHIDDTLVEPKKTFLKLHETGHHELPTHRKLFQLFQDCDKTLAPEVADLFEREANNFARFALFQGDAFHRQAADLKCELKTPMKLAKTFGASVYASAREFARTHHRACAVYVLEPIDLTSGQPVRALVRRIETSRSFYAQFGQPSDTVIAAQHVLWKVLPIGRRMCRPTTVAIRDRVGISHECIAEAFDTTFNVLVLVVPIKALTATTIILPTTVASEAR